MQTAAAIPWQWWFVSAASVQQALGDDMSKRYEIELSEDELIALINAINHAAHAISADECSTLIGVAQDTASELHGKLLKTLKPSA